MSDSHNVSVDTSDLEEVTKVVIRSADLVDSILRQVHSGCQGLDVDSQQVDSLPEARPGPLPLARHVLPAMCELASIAASDRNHAMIDAVRTDLVHANAVMQSREAFSFPGQTPAPSFHIQAYDLALWLLDDVSIHVPAKMLLEIWKRHQEAIARRSQALDQLQSHDRDLARKLSFTRIADPDRDELRSGLPDNLQQPFDTVVDTHSIDEPFRSLEESLASGSWRRIVGSLRMREIPGNAPSFPVIDTGRLKTLIEQEHRVAAYERQRAGQAGEPPAEAGAIVSGPLNDSLQRQEAKDASAGASGRPGQWRQNQTMGLLFEEPLRVGYADTDEWFEMREPESWRMLKFLNSQQSATHQEFLDDYGKGVKANTIASRLSKMRSELPEDFPFEFENRSAKLSWRPIVPPKKS